MQKISKDKLVNLLSLIGLIILAAAFFIYVLNLPYYIIISVIISSFVIFLFSKIKWITPFIINTLIVIWNIILLIFTLVPDYSKEIDTKWFYQQQNSYIKIFIQDNDDILKENKAWVRILNENSSIRKYYPLYDTDTKDLKIYIWSWDLILFESKTNQLNSFINVYLWDWSIIRVLPTSNIKITQLLKDADNPLQSKTSIQINKWSIWFDVIKTIIDKDSFNLETQYWTVVIRWTSWFIKQSDEDTLIYSNDHIIQAINLSWENTLIANQEVLQMSAYNVKKLDLWIFIQDVWENLYKNMKKISELDDKQWIQSYQNQLHDYIVENFGSSLLQSQQLTKLMEIKFFIYSLFDKKYSKYKDNYYEYKLLTTQNVDKNLLNKYNDNIDEIIFIPINSNLENLKFKFLEQKSIFDKEFIETFVINIYNKVLDWWKQINLDEVLNAMQSNNYLEQVKTIYNSIMDNE